MPTKVAADRTVILVGFNMLIQKGNESLSCK